MIVSAPILKHVSHRVSIIRVSVFTYGDLEDQLLATVLGLKSVENGRELLTLELDCARTLAACSSHRAQAVAAARRRAERTYRRRRHR